MARAKKVPAKKIVKKAATKKAAPKVTKRQYNRKPKVEVDLQQPSPETSPPAEQTTDKQPNPASFCVQMDELGRIVGDTIHQRFQAHIDNANVLHARMAQHESVQKLLEIEKRFALIGSLSSDDRAILQAERELARRVYERNTEAFEKAARKAGV